MESGYGPLLKDVMGELMSLELMLSICRLGSPSSRLTRLEQFQRSPYTSWARVRKGHALRLSIHSAHAKWKCRSTANARVIMYKTLASLLRCDEGHLNNCRCCGQPRYVGLRRVLWLSLFSAMESLAWEGTFPSSRQCKPAVDTSLDVRTFTCKVSARECGPCYLVS